MARACGPARHQTSKLHLDDFGKSSVNIINRPCADHENDISVPLFSMLFGRAPTGQLHWGGRHRRRPCRTQCIGTCFYYYRSAGRTQSMFYGEGFWLMTGGKVAERLQCHLIYWLLSTVMRSNSVLTSLHLPSLSSFLSLSILIFFPPYLCLWQPPSFLRGLSQF